MKVNKLFLFIISLLVAVNLSAQEDSLPVTLRMEINKATDSMCLFVTSIKNKKPCSLMVLATAESTGQTDTLFFPVVDDTQLFCLIYPVSIKSNLLLRVYYSPSLFRITGRVINTKEEETINAVLITKNKQFYKQEIKVETDSSFNLPPMLFETNATVAFNYGSKTKKHPDIVLDSIIKINNFNQLVFSEFIKRDSINGTAFAKTDTIAASINTDNKYKALDEIKVVSKLKSNAEKFNDTYSNGLFNGAGERLIDCLDNDDILSFIDCFTYISTKVPGITFTTSNFGEMTMMWRGKEVQAFFIDEIAVDIQQMMGVPVTDIAIIKVYPAPFSGVGLNGDGGAIAIYTRRGEYLRKNSEVKKWLFSLKGYSPVVSVLFDKKQ